MLAGADIARADLKVCLSELEIPYETQARVHSTLVTSRAELVIYPDAEQVTGLLPLLQSAGVDYQPLGSSSDSLLMGTDSSPMKTTLISARRLRGIDIDAAKAQVTAESGAPICALSQHTVKAGLSGLEFARYIPGTTAGAIVTDAGHSIYDYETGFDDTLAIDDTATDIRKVLTSVDVVTTDGEVCEVPVADLEMNNRKSCFSDPDNDLFILRAYFTLTEADPAVIAQIQQAVKAGRQSLRLANRERNPHSVGRTLGYTFVASHPLYHGRSAMELIATTASLEGDICVNGMHHSSQTPNIIANMGAGTPDGYLRLSELIQRAVQAEHDTEMPLEVNIVR